MSHIPLRLGRIAGALALAHVALIFAGISLQQGPLFADGAQGIEDQYVQGDLARTFSGGLLEAFGFVLLVPVLVLLARLLGRRSEEGRWASRSGLLCGIAYVAVVFAVGFPAGAAAMYGAQNGLDADTAFALNNIRLFAHFLSMFLLAGSTAGIALAAIADRTNVKWVGGFGLVTTVALVASPPLTVVQWQDIGSFVWIVWFVGVAVQLLRGRIGAATSEPAPSAETVNSTGSGAEAALLGHS
ncbi:hypothetical protein N802_19275 [Knoellia sinensis KCTC 19936]|uniref:DUF4386 family protein n=1 Tax=Knoellia sinensis KCTC 19936 TaxID=1385520 RepID=A0A0A0J8L7_9MICO|nr:hypothetical protein [Knoellia sinensis]KGN31961.1 hypothetical protein N802_19275 [Knoellia sinensis KCTC 19936]